MVHTEDCSTGYVSKKLSNFPFPFSINSREYKEAVLLGEYLEKNGFKEEADVIYLKETKKVPTRWLCSESDYFGRTCYCRIADSK